MILGITVAVKYISFSLQEIRWSSYLKVFLSLLVTTAEDINAFFLNELDTFGRNELFPDTFGSQLRIGQRQVKNHAKTGSIL